MTATRVSLALLLAFTFGQSVVSGADDYAKGCASYSTANYGAAKAQFMSAIKAKPKFWQARYQLANTFMQLNDKENARKEYEACLSLQPSEDMKVNCQRAISYLLAPAVPVPQKSAPPEMFSGSLRRVVGEPPAATTSSDTSTSTRSAENSDYRAVAIASRKARIMKEAEEQAAIVRASGKRQIEEANASANQWWLNRETGEVHVGISRDQETDIQREADMKASRILEEARKRAGEITTY